MRRILAAAAMWAAATGASAQEVDLAPAQQNPAIEADIQCAAIGLAMAGGDNAQGQQAGTLMALYFIGRVQGASGPDFDLENAILAQIRTLSTAQVASDRVRCAAELRVVGQSLTAIDERLR